jgi:hypothetical protein
MEMITLLYLLIVSGIIILFNSLIIYYLYLLEDSKCNCIRDWRHDFVKYYSMIMIAFLIINIFLRKNHIYLSLVLFLVGVVNLYSFFSYVGELQETKCACALEHSNLNSFINFLRWLYLIGYVFWGFGVVMGLVMLYKFRNFNNSNKATNQRSLSGSKKA